jgi:hypothetical protein
VKGIRQAAGDFRPRARYHSPYKRRPESHELKMSYSISTLLIRNLHDVFGENDPARRRAAINEIFTEDSVFYDPNGVSIVAATRSIASRARSRRLIPTFDISRLPSPRNWAMGGASNGYRAALATRQLTPGLISSLPGTARLPLPIYFSTSYREQGSVVCHSSSPDPFELRASPGWFCRPFRRRECTRFPDCSRLTRVGVPGQGLDHR